MPEPCSEVYTNLFSVKQKEFIASQKTLLQDELGQCKTESEKKTVREQ